MLTVLLYPLFKFYRKANEWKVKLYSSGIKKYYLSLSKGRFRIHSSVSIGKSFFIKSDITLSSILIEEGVDFRDNCKIRIGKSGKIIIRKNTFFNDGCSVNCYGNISIGENCQFGEDVKFYDHNHKYTNEATLISDQGYAIGSITIGNNCWFGSNVIILKDVHIGDNTVVGAGCVIVKSIPAGSVIINKQNITVV